MTHLEYMIRIFMLFVYFIDELPSPLTMRSFLEFLNQKLVIEKENIPIFCFPLPAGTTFSIEFCGFVRGDEFRTFKPSPELDADVIAINKSILPPDEELAALLDEENAGGCQLIRAAQYSGILPGGEEEHSEEMLDDDEWDERIRKQKEEVEMKKRRKMIKHWHDEADGGDMMKRGEMEEELLQQQYHQEQQQEEEEEEDEELPKEYVELMKKDKMRKRRLKEKKNKLKRSRNIPRSCSVCEITRRRKYDDIGTCSLSNSIRFG